VRIVSNMGAANPRAAARLIRKHAQDNGLGEVSCAVVLGDDVAELVRVRPDLPLMETGLPLESILPRMASANAYLGADAICRGLETGAQIVITGRVADPSLFVAPAMHHYGWRYDDWARIASATAAGHLLECSAQVSGGCFADPVKKPCPTSPGWAFRMRTSRTTAASGSASWPTRAAASISRRARSSCSTKCTIPPRTSRRIASSTSPT
jgi:hypothetical protein